MTMCLLYFKFYSTFNCFQAKSKNPYLDSQVSMYLSCLFSFIYYLSCSVFSKHMSFSFSSKLWFALPQGLSTSCFLCLKCCVIHSHSIPFTYLAAINFSDSNSNVTSYNPRLSKILLSYIFITYYTFSSLHVS